MFFPCGDCVALVEAHRLDNQAPKFAFGNGRGVVGEDGLCPSAARDGAQCPTNLVGHRAVVIALERPVGSPGIFGEFARFDPVVEVRIVGQYLNDDAVGIGERVLHIRDKRGDIGQRLDAFVEHLEARDCAVVVVDVHFARAQAVTFFAYKARKVDPLQRGVDQNVVAVADVCADACDELGVFFEQSLVHFCLRKILYSKSHRLSSPNRAIANRKSVRLRFGVARVALTQRRQDVFVRN